MDIRVPFRTPHLQLSHPGGSVDLRVSAWMGASGGKGRFAHVSYANALILLGLFPGSSDSLSTQVSEIRADVACYK